jgi:hypothetical protein
MASRAGRLNSGVRAHQATDWIKNNNRLAVRVRDMATRFLLDVVGDLALARRAFGFIASGSCVRQVAG